MLGEGMEPEATGLPAYHAAMLLKIYIYGYLNRIQSSRRLEGEAQHNVELVWLTGKLLPDFKASAAEVSPHRNDRSPRLSSFTLTPLACEIEAQP